MSPDTSKELPVSIQKTRREFLKSAFGVGTGALLAGVGASELADIATAIPSTAETAIQPYENLDQQFLFGDHVLYIDETKHLLADNPQSIVSGEIRASHVRAAKSYTADIPVFNENQPQQTPIEFLSGINSSSKKSNESLESLQWILDHGHSIITCDTEIPAWNDELMQTFIATKVGAEMVKVTAAYYSIAEAIRQGKAMVTKDTLPSTTRRTFLQLGGSALAALATGLGMSAFGSESKVTSSVSNEPSVQITQLTTAIENDLAGLLSGKEAKVFADILVHQRSLNMLRNADIGAEFINANKNNVDQDQEKLSFLFKAGGGHADIVLYRRQTYEQQDEQIRSYASELIDTYTELFDSPQESRLDNADNRELGWRFLYQAQVGFGLPSGHGRIEDTYRQFKLPESLPKSTAMVFVETFQRKLDQMSAEKRKVMEPYLEEYISRLSSYMMDEDIPSNGIPTLDALHLYPELHPEQDMRKAITVFDQYQGKTMADLALETDKQFDSKVLEVHLLYGYISYLGVPRPVYINLHRSALDQPLEGQLLYGSVSKDTSQRIDMSFTEVHSDD